MIRSNSAGTSEFNRTGGTEALFRMASNSTAALAPPKGAFPVALSYSTAPTEKMSVRASHCLAPRLLRRHVGYRAHGQPGVLSMNPVEASASGLPLSQLREAEIQHFGLATRSHEDIPRLEVAMHDPAPVRSVQRVSHSFA